MIVDWDAMAGAGLTRRREARGLAVLAGDLREEREEEYWCISGQHM